MQSRLLLDVVVGEGAAILELLAGEDETLLVRRNALLVWATLDAKLAASTAPHTLNLGLHIVDGVRRLHLKGDSLAREGLYENLHGGLDRSVMRSEREWVAAYLDNNCLPQSSVQRIWCSRCGGTDKI